MSCTINHMSSYSVQLLNSSSAGTVHSVYRKTVNILVNGYLLALQSQSSPLSPISLITSLSQFEMENMAFTPGQQVLIAPQKVIILADGFQQIFSWEKAEITDLKLHSCLDKKQAFDLSIKIKETLFLANTGGFEVLFKPSLETELTPALSAAKKYIDNSICSLSSKNYAEAAHFLCRLIGLGTGLTPSGDDFLCGVLAGLRLQTECDPTFFSLLSREISEHLKDTNDISAAFLACAVHNQYSLAVNSLRHLPDVPAILSSFLAIGHSSGIDTLCGVYYALHYADVSKM